MQKQKCWLLSLALVSVLLAQGWVVGPLSGFRYTRFDGEYFPGTGKVYFLGGRLSDANTEGSIWSFDPLTGVYADVLVDMPLPISNYDICLLRDDYDLAAGDTFGLYVFGGRLNSGANLDSIQVYYPVSNRARVLPDDPYPGRVGGQIPAAMTSVVRDSRAYVTGGFNATNYIVSNQTWVFDPLATAGSRWTQLRDLPLARAYPVGAVVDSFVFAMGGDTFDGTSLYARAQCWRFNTLDSATGWTAIRSLPKVCAEARGYGFDMNSLYGFNGQVLVAGRGLWPEESSDCFIYSAFSDTWDTFPHLNMARRNHAGAFIPGAQGSGGVPGIWVWGGRQGSDTMVLTMPEYYQLQWVNVSEQTGARVGAGMSVSPNPARGTVTVSSGPAQGRPAKLSVYNVLGSPVRTGRSAGGIFTLKGLRPGTYVIRLETAAGIDERKLVVTR